MKRHIELSAFACCFYLLLSFTALAESSVSGESPNNDQFVFTRQQAFADWTYVVNVEVDALGAAKLTLKESYGWDASEQAQLPILKQLHLSPNEAKELVSELQFLKRCEHPPHESTIFDGDTLFFEYMRGSFSCAVEQQSPIDSAWSEVGALLLRHLDEPIAADELIPREPSAKEFREYEKELRYLRGLF